MKKIFLFVILFIGIILTGCVQKQKVSTDNSRKINSKTQIGEQKNKNSCSKGYKWCEAKIKCLKDWEGECPKNEEEKIKMIQSMSIAAGKLSGLRGLETSLSLYLLGGDLPISLSELINKGFANSEVKKFINENSVYYSYSTDRKRYHIGVKIELPYFDAKDYNSIFGRYDKNYNSKKSDYVNGFDGSDPVYDLSN